MNERLCTYLYTRRNKQQQSTSIHTHTHLHMAYYHMNRLTHMCVCVRRRTRENTSCYTAQLYKRRVQPYRTKRMHIYREKEERTSFNCSSRPQVYTRSVCICVYVCVISCIRLLICAGDRIRQKAFPTSNRILDFTYREVSNNQLPTSQTLIYQEKKHFQLYILLLFLLLIVFFNSVLYTQ